MVCSLEVDDFVFGFWCSGVVEVGFSVLMFLDEDWLELENLGVLGF